MQFSDHTTLYQKHELRACLNDLGLVRVRVYDPAIARVILREERLALAYSPHTTIGKRISDSVDLECLNGQVLIVYPSEPRPSFADQVLNALSDRRICAAELLEVRSLQTALGLVAAGEGLCLMPHMAKIRSDIHYALLNDSSITSPIIFSHRLNDSSWYIEAMTDLTKKQHGR